MPLPASTGRSLAVILSLCAVLWLSGCATPPPAAGPGSRANDPRIAAARARILAAAERLIGTPYVLGGESPDGVDCSGLVQYAYLQAGIPLPRTALEQFQAGQPQRRVLPGDLLFFRTGQNGVISHVGIYAGKGHMIHASSSSRQVRKVSLAQRYWQEHMAGGATFLDSPGVAGNPSLVADRDR